MRKSLPPNGLLGQSDPDPVKIFGQILSPSPFLLIGDHAGRAIPATLGDLGLAEADRQRHIAVDIGVEELGLALGERLRAPFLRQAYSRLVVDCNRDPRHDGAIAATSDGTVIPANVGLSEADRRGRIVEVFEPYQQAIGGAIASRSRAGLETILVSLHSFTPVMAGVARTCQIGVLHDGGETAFALRLLARLRGQKRFVVADNEPYVMDGTDYTVPRHAYPLGLRYVELEVRQDLLWPPSTNSLADIAELLAAALSDCA